MSPGHDVKFLKKENEKLIRRINFLQNVSYDLENKDILQRYGLIWVPIFYPAKIILCLEKLKCHEFWAAKIYYP